MKEYHSQQIRNVAFSGHSGAGKTALVESVAFNLKLTDRLGRVEDGNTISDYDPEEIKRHVSINASLIPVERLGAKINILDLPGYRDFVGEIRNSMRVCDGVAIVVDASAGVEVGAELAWEYAGEFNLPCVFIVNKIDRERANYENALNEIKKAFGCRLVTVTYPMGGAASFEGCVDLLKMKMSKGDNGKSVDADIPAQARKQADDLRAELIEAAAEGEDAITEKFLEEAALTSEEILRGIKLGMMARRICPVLTVSAAQGAGVTNLLDFIVNCFPSPTEREAVMAKNVKSQADVELKCDESAPAVAYVFKTISDPYTGHLTFFKVIQGEVVNDSLLSNISRGHEERVNHLMTMRGKKPEPVNKVSAGDIGVLAKLNATHTGDTLCAPKTATLVQPTTMPPITVQMAVTAKSKEDEEKIGMVIHRLIEQDPTLNLHRDPAIKQTIISGMGETQLDVAVARLKYQSKVEVELHVPKVPYRETITRKAEGQGKHKKQSGGRGQFGECWLRLEPQPEGAGFAFEWKIVGGVIPTKYQPSVEKGIVQAMERGIVAGYPAVDIMASCYDGKDHPVDSSDMAFQIAASKGFKAIARTANPILLEPICKVKVIVPEQYMGDVMGDLNSRRGRILGMNAEGRKQIVDALVPLSEMYEYSKQLRSITQGRGTFEMVYDHYERLPADLQNKIVAAAAPEAEEEE